MKDSIGLPWADWCVSYAQKVTLTYLNWIHFQAASLLFPISIDGPVEEVQDSDGDQQQPEAATKKSPAPHVTGPVKYITKKRLAIFVVMKPADRSVK